MRELPLKWLVVTTALISLTWPMAVAHLALRYAFTRPYVADQAARLAIPASVLVAVIAVAISFRRPPKDAVSWVFRCAASGAILGDLWLALGAYVHAQHAFREFLATLLGGILYGMPVGLVVGMALGAEVITLRHWAERFGAGLSIRRFAAITVIINALVAIGIWYGADGVGRSEPAWSSVAGFDYTYTARIHPKTNAAPRSGAYWDWACYAGL